MVAAACGAVTVRNTTTATTKATTTTTATPPHNHSRRRLAFGAAITGCPPGTPSVGPAGPPGPAGAIGPGPHPTGAAFAVNPPMGGGGGAGLYSRAATAALTAGSPNPPSHCSNAG